VVQQERQLTGSFFVSNINNINSNRVNSSKICAFCGYGHSKIFCFKKIGFRNQENRTFKINNNRKLCTYCNGNGHTIDTCYQKHGYPLGYKVYSSGKTNQANNVIIFL